MIIWIDAQISPAMAIWINTHSTAQAVAIRDIGLRDAQDIEIFESAKRHNATIMTKR
jgi:predicted nuclease of predicted toxin-antitoxin system